MYEFSLLQLLMMSAVVSLVGIIIGYLCAGLKNNDRQQEEKIRTLEEQVVQLEDHKSKVSDHFQKTAGLLHEMTGQYKAIYAHMAEGAEALCDENEGGVVLESLQERLRTSESAPELERMDEDTNNEQDRI